MLLPCHTHTQIDCNNWDDGQDIPALLAHWMILVKLVWVVVVLHDEVIVMGMVVPVWMEQLIVIEMQLVLLLLCLSRMMVVVVVVEEEEVQAKVHVNLVEEPSLEQHHLKSLYGNMH